MPLPPPSCAWLGPDRGAASGKLSLVNRVTSSVHERQDRDFPPPAPGFPHAPTPADEAGGTADVNESDHPRRYAAPRVARRAGLLRCSNNGFDFAHNLVYVPSVMTWETANMSIKRILRNCKTAPSLEEEIDERARASVDRRPEDRGIKASQCW